MSGNEFTSYPNARTSLLDALRKIDSEDSRALLVAELRKADRRGGPTTALLLAGMARAGQVREAGREAVIRYLGDASQSVEDRARFVSWEMHAGFNTKQLFIEDPGSLSRLTSLVQDLEAQLPPDTEESTERQNLRQAFEGFFRGE